MKCENCKWYVAATETKVKFNKAWDLKKIDGICCLEPKTEIKTKEDFCSHFEKKDEVKLKD